MFLFLFVVIIIIIIIRLLQCWYMHNFWAFKLFFGSFVVLFWERKIVDDFYMIIKTHVFYNT